MHTGVGYLGATDVLAVAVVKALGTTASVSVAASTDSVGIGCAADDTDGKW
jgi:hypothetical protein